MGQPRVCDFNKNQDRGKAWASPPFFLSVVSPGATQPNGLMNLAYVGALFLAGAVLSLGIGLV